MISDDEFFDPVQYVLGRDLRDPDNAAQFDAVSHHDNRVLKIVAGPGSGKTTVLILRALRAVLVHGVLPEHILITTFTRKAARELRTRWLDWGTQLLQSFPSGATAHIDLNRCRIDTLDSIAQQALTEFRPAGTLAPVVAESSASNLIFKRVAFSQQPVAQSLYYNNKVSLDALFARYTFEQQPPRNQGEALGVAKRLIERLVQDRVNTAAYAAQGTAQAIVVEMLSRYRQRAVETNVFDFALMEELFLDRLQAGALDEWLESVRILLIDEYQDTNPLQEAIYFSILERAKPEMTIVGDDDQSMYRFRGGSVELFTQFASRCAAATGAATRRVDMVRNFRSRPEVVRFYNDYVVGDPGFLPARIAPPKPLVVASRQSEGFPVLGLFRDSPQSLAATLAQFFRDLRTNRGIRFGNGGPEITLSDENDLGDAVLLSHTVEEVRYNAFDHSSQERFPSLFRQAMLNDGMSVFNPRGQALRSNPDVSILLGLLLASVDPSNQAIDEVLPTNQARHFLTAWRQAGDAFIETNPPPNDGYGLPGFVAAWQSAANGQVVRDFSRDWPTLELLFTLLSWVPLFQTEPEHQVWLEAITRIITSASMASPYGMQLLQNTSATNQGVHVWQSRVSFVRDALLPIAENEVDVDEEILASVPRDRLQIMTIHQAKGLEFPLVVVDVGSHFTMNHPSQRFRRFPDRPGNVVQAEDDVEAHLSAPLRTGRLALDRAFDDLVRLYYVAYSRPQSVLMLIGCESCLNYGRGPGHSQGAIPNIALCWRRDSTWPWRQVYPGQRPPVRVNTPMLLIEQCNLK